MKTVRLVTCDDAMQAHILQGALENEGIESVLHNEYFSSIYKCNVGSIAGVDILVAESDYKRALEVLKQNHSWQEEQELCPFCGSSEIKLVWKRGHHWRAAASLLLSQLSAIPLKGGKHWEYECKQCHKLFDHPLIR